MSWLLLLHEITDWVIRITMLLVILRRRFDTGTALAWLGIVFFIPLVGLFLYLLLGVPFLGRERVASHSRVVGTSRSQARMDEIKRHAVPPGDNLQQSMMMIQAEQVGGNPIVGGNAAEPIADNNTFVDRLVSDIDTAQDHAHLLYYIFRDDEAGSRVIESLIRAAERGVACRLLVDGSGSRPLLRSHVVRRMRNAGVRVWDMLPVRLWRRKLARLDLRNHRKIAVIDGRVAFTGSHNIVEDSYGHKRAGKWVDLSARLTGPVVSQLQMVFLDDWAFTCDEQLDAPDLFPRHEATGEIAAQVVPTGPNHESTTFRRVLLAALNSARRKIILTTPYLVLDEPTHVALAMAADRGVDVTIIAPARSDRVLVNLAGQYYYDELLDAGVTVQRFYGGLLHAKTITVDDAFGLLGSANLDIRSFYLNFEINVLMYGPGITSRLRFAQQHYLASAEELTLREWARRPGVRRYLEGAAALCSPVL